MIWSKRYRWRFGDIDDAGIAYYPSFFHYWHCAFEDWWAEALGIPYPRVLHEEKFGLPVVAVRADFFRPIRYGDEPDVSLAILAVGTTSVEIAFWMSVPGESGPRARARLTTVSMDMERRVKQPVPVRWREAFARFAISEAEFPARG